MGAERGQMLSHYRLVEKIGEGGMGEVYRARDPRLGRDVAIKLLPAAYSADPDRLARLKQEARAAGSLNHPNILTIHDIGLHEGAPYVVSELLEGKTLKERLTLGPIPLPKAVDYALQIAQGLAVAHDKGIVHRDLKPANLFLTRDGRMKILDFGLAKLMPGEESNTITQASAIPAETEPGVVLGTMGYMSPEQVRGQPADHRSDIFSLGAVLYEMLAGRRAFQGTSAPDTMSAILKEDPATLVGIPPALERIVRHCLEKEQAQRFQSARDLVFALQALPETSGPAQASPARPSRLWAWSAAAFGGVFLVVTGIWLSRSARSPESKAATVQGAPSSAGGAGLPFAQEAEIASVAVLPFTDMSAEKDEEYFSDGVAEELLNTLARIPGLRVTGRTSSFSFKGKNEDLRVIGQKLNVGTILEGSVRKSGKRVRITAQLVNAADGFHLWSESYDRTLDDIFAVQEEIASSVAGALNVVLLGKEKPKGRGGSVEAYNAYLQAEHFFNRGSREDVEKAVGYYEQALALDPHDALAWARLSAAQCWRASNEFMPPDEGWRKARDAAERALALDANLAEAHSVLGLIKRSYDWDWAGAEIETKRALALEPSNAVAVQRAGSLAGTLGRHEEAVQWIRRTVEIDPLNVFAWRSLGIWSWYAGQLDEAEAAFTKALELSPEYPSLHFLLGAVYLSQGRPERTLAEAERELLPCLRLQALAVAIDALKREQDADAALGELVEKCQDNWAFQIAEVCASRGDVDQALEWLERAYEQRDTGLSQVKGDPLLKNLEGNPRYTAFLKKMRL